MKVRGIVCLLACGMIVGCLPSSEPTPAIVTGPVDYEPLPAAHSVGSRQQTTILQEAVPGEWIPPRNVERSWGAIVIHHSGTPNGNAAIFDRWHREGNHWQGVGYDFVIGNGTDSPDGAVEVTFRWRQQIAGAHCKTPDNWANQTAVGICLVGNYNETAPTPKQIASLQQLVEFLRHRYRIDSRAVYTHQHTPGARVTDCPGRHFDMSCLGL
ncbi:peptidoglycan recognition family protein [Planctomycetota bacterium]